MHMYVIGGTNLGADDAIPIECVRGVTRVGEIDEFVPRCIGAELEGDVHVEIWIDRERERESEKRRQSKRRERERRA